MSNKIFEAGDYESKMEMFKELCIERRMKTSSYCRSIVAQEQKLSLQDRVCKKIISQHLTSCANQLFPNTEGLSYANIFHVEGEIVSNALIAKLQFIFQPGGNVNPQGKKSVNKKTKEKVDSSVDGYLKLWKEGVIKEVETRKREHFGFLEDPFLTYIESKIVTPYFLSKDTAARNFKDLCKSIKYERRQHIYHKSVVVINIFGSLEDISVDSPYYRNTSAKINNIRKIIQCGKQTQAQFRVIENINRWQKLLVTISIKYLKKDVHCKRLMRIIKHMDSFTVYDKQGFFIKTAIEVDEYYKFWVEYKEDKQSIGRLIKKLLESFGP
jgi:hypothetical protein